MGRPTDYTAELGQIICDRVAEDESLAAICREQGMPSRNTVYRWLREHEEFGDNYTRARLEQGETVADTMRDLRLKVETGEIKPDAARVIMDALKWEAGKRAPKKYGDKAILDHNHTFAEDVAEWLGLPKS